MIAFATMSTNNKTSQKPLTTSIGLTRYAFDYIEAALVLEESAANKVPSDHISPIPAYFLAIHGIELCLKAFLMHRGLSLKELRGLSHNLHALFRKSKELGLLDNFTVHPNDMVAMNLLITLNKDSGLRYIKTGLKEFPSWSIVEPLAVRLHQSVAGLVRFKTFTNSYAAYA